MDYLMRSKQNGIIQKRNVSSGRPSLAPTTVPTQAITANILQETLQNFGVQYDDLTIQRMILEAAQDPDANCPPPDPLLFYR